MEHPVRAKTREKARRLLARIHDIREARSGAVSIEELLDLIGSPPDADLQRRLADRGPINVEFDDDSKGSFHSVGPPFSAPFGPGEVRAPGEVAGAVTFRDGQVVLSFDPSKTFIGRLLILSLPLQRIEISDHHVALRFPGGTFDQEYAF